ncbi:MAG: hypothetical protein GEU93_16755 [Propionibacteriales bacterium]|nr:hypothetical protein [Propionibacteriales bacterium]
MVKALTGRRNKANTWGHQLRDVVKAFGHEGARARLGVSKSTWRAWTKGRRSPNKGNLSKIAGTWNSRDVRQAMIPARRGRKASTNGFKVSLTGLLGPTNDPRYARVRKIAAEFPPDVAQQIMDAFVDGGPEAANEEIRRAISEHYFGRDPDELATLDDVTDVDFKAKDERGGGSYFDDFDE